MKKSNLLWTKMAAIALGVILTVGVGFSVSSALEKPNEAYAGYTAGHYYLTGIDGWSTDDNPAYELVQVGTSNIYQWTGEIVANKEFKLNVDGTWNLKGFSHLSGVCKTNKTMTTPGGDNIKVNSTNNYKISYNPVTGDFVADYVSNQYYLVGSMQTPNGWTLENTQYPLAHIGGTVYQWVGTLSVNDEFKLYTSNGWDGVIGYDALSGTCKSSDKSLQEVWYEQGGSGSGNWVTNHNIRVNYAMEIRITFNSYTCAFTAEPDVTKRVWLDTTAVSWWDGDLENALVGIFYWVAGGSLPTSWPGVEMKKDNANGLWYFDVSSEVTHAKFTRINKADQGAAFNKSIDVELPSSPGNSKFVLSTHQIDKDPGEPVDLEQDGTSVGFSPTASTAVLDFAATIDTQAEACSAEAASAAIATYLCLPTFEQNQFDSYSFGVTPKTGAQTLAYLKAYFGVTTPLNVNVLDTTANRTTAIILIVIVLGFASVAGFYIVGRKREVTQF